MLVSIIYVPTTLDKQVLLGLRHGLERENLRVNAQGHLSQRAHFEALGVSPKDATFTLDFAESQLEVVTPIHLNNAELIHHLQTLDQKIKTAIQPEKLWRASMPPPFSKDEIKLAYFGETQEDLQKQTYRKGLCYRYGKMMQIISGIHYNLSFPDELFQNSTRNEVYFKTMRQFLRHYWILILLFGASPICFAASLKPKTDLSHLKTEDHFLYYGPDATSLRLSELGYHNPDFPELQIQYTSLEAYVQSLQKAVDTPYLPYQAIPAQAQLNDHYLQIENEYYAPIRPKPFLKDAHLPLTQRLAKHGVNYLEIRILDLNPLLDLEIDEPTLNFIDLFMLYLTTQAEGPFHLKESQENALTVSKFGLDFSRKLKKEGQALSISNWAESLLQALQDFAKKLESPPHLESVAIQIQKLHQPDLLPAKIMLSHRHHYLDWMLNPESTS